MSDNIKMQDTENKNEWIKWFEEAIDKEHIKYYEYKEFNNFQEIGTGGFGKVYRANWKNLDKCFAIKSFFSLDNLTVKEIIRELKNQREVDYHDNIIRCHGITKFESTEYHVSNNYMLVMEYANNGSLRSYLKKNFGKLTWDDKYIMAYQLQPPFYVEGEQYDVGLALEILQGLRETVVPATPENYVKIYTRCWDGEPDNRLNIYQVVDCLKEMITKSDAIAENFQLSGEQEINDASSTNNSESQGDLSQLIQNFNKMNTKEIGSVVVLSKQENLTTEKDFNRIVDKINELIYKLSNKGTDWKLINGQVIEYLNNYNTNPEEIYIWLSNNQNSSNSIFLFGYFNWLGIATSVDRKNSFNLFIIASNQDHILAQYFVSDCYLYGYGTTKNEKLGFKYSEKTASKNFANGILSIGYCYEKGIGTKINKQRAVELYQKSANLENMVAQHNLGIMYEYGDGITKDINKAIYWYEKSANQGYQDAQIKLEILREK